MPRKLDWDSIRIKLQQLALLPTPISLAEATRRLDLDPRHLYLQANKEARVIGERWKQYIKQRGENAQAKARPYIEAACRMCLADGKAISLREIEARVPGEILCTVERLFDMLHEIKQEIGVY
jgi:hypothetical protein